MIAAHILALILILSDNILLFRYIKNNSNQIKEFIESVTVLKNLSSPIIRDLNYRKIEVIASNECEENLKVSKSIINEIEENRLKGIETFLNHYKESKSILANTIFLGDLIDEFMNNNVDTLFFPFIGETKYCYDIMNTQWCQHETVELFVYPVKVILKNYEPVLSLNQYSLLKSIVDVSACGSDDVVINLVIDSNPYSSKSYYLYIYDNEAFITTDYQVTQING